MRLGIDLGTTRTVVAAADRGNYPVVSFESHAGDVQEFYPFRIAAGPDGFAFGLDAEALGGSTGWHFVHALKRRLADADPSTRVRVGEHEAEILELLTGYLETLRRDLHACSNLELEPDEPLEAWISVPANANNNQRFLTVEAFRRAGFEVRGVLNEPSAAGIEYAHRSGGRRGAARRGHLAVYDLGGGTFDVSVIAVEDDRRFEVVTTEGIGRLGGNDFDAELLRMALAAGGRAGDPDDPALYFLLEECRERKEGLHPNTRRVAVDLGLVDEEAGEVLIPVADFYARLEPMVERTLDALDTALGRLDPQARDEVAAVYLVGGACSLPLVGRMIRERHGRKVKRSPYPFSATAVGLAVAAELGGALAVSERFTRHFGVWREAEAGRRIVFDPIFAKDTPLPGPTDPPLELTRRYAPAHNVGHFRYVECSGLDAGGEPAGDLYPWEQVWFPLDPALKRKRRLDVVAVEDWRGEPEASIEETYTCDADGVIRVTIANRRDGYRRRFELRRGEQAGA